MGDNILIKAEMEVEQFHGSNQVHEWNESVVKSENDGVNSCIIPKTEDIDSKEEFIDGENIYERQEYIDNIEFIIKTEADVCLSDKEDKAEDVKEYKCDSFQSVKRNLKSHVDSVHLELKQYWCHQCDYSSRHKGNLKKHIDSVHLKFKQHKCQQCDYLAGQKSHLNDHMNSVHLKLKRYECHHCDYSASSKGNLKIHTNSVHLNLKRYKCQLCDYSSNHKSTLKSHIDSVHSNFEE